MKRFNRKSAYTLVEVLIAAGLMSIVMSGIFSLFLQYQNTLKPAQAQVTFNANARYGVHYLTRIVQRAKSVTVSADEKSVDAVYPDGTIQTITFDTGDGNVNTIRDNVLRVGTRVLARYVSPTRRGTQDLLPIFSYHQIPNPTTGVQERTGSVIIQFHVGDGANSALSNTITGAGYQGNEVRETIRPRNFTPPSWDNFDNN